jgi:hypothetical protein
MHVMEKAPVQVLEQEIQQFSQNLYRDNPDWVTFFREILGKNGIVRRMFPTREALAEFEKTETYRQILEMLTELRTRGPLPPRDQEPTKVITVRLPYSLYDALYDEAHELHTTVNKLCISKLLQFIDGKIVPTRRSLSASRQATSTG